MEVKEEILNSMLCWVLEEHKISEWFQTQWKRVEPQMEGVTLWWWWDKGTMIPLILALILGEIIQGHNIEIYQMLMEVPIEVLPIAL